MAVVRAPKDADKYLRPAWDAKPRRAEAADCLKEACQDQDTLETIAARVSMSWKKVHWWDLALLNWGTSDWAEINWYLTEVSEGRQWTGGGTATDKTYKWITVNPAGTIWVPKPRQDAVIRFRSPGKQDVGHVAMDTEADQHLNTLVIPAVYAIDLQLGETDALFEPISDGGNPPEQVVGVRQRLQVLGYLYTALTHPKIAGVTREVWAHYKKLSSGAFPHNALPGVPANPTDDQLRTRLREEVINNIVSLIYGDFPTRSGQVHVGRLPAPGEFAAIRLPGGYCFNKEVNFQGPYYEFNWNKFGLGDDRDKIEDQILKDNELLHAVPLIATVHKVLPDGTTQPAENVSVYFQLVPPDTPPKNCALRAPDLRDTEFDYSKDWKDRELGYNYNQNQLRSSIPWNAALPNPCVKRIVQGALAEKEEDREAWITGQVNAATVNAVERQKLKYDVDSILKTALENDAPYEVKDAGPKRFVDDVFKSNSPADRDDPQAENAPAKFGGKRDVPVHLGASGPDQPSGTFEISKERPGLHTYRGLPYTDFGTMTLAEAVTPTEELDENGRPIKVHNHAVRAQTNAKGNACVLFRPSRCGGDRYKIRAYVGPPTLAFDGRNPDGPVTETGTLVVWRNLRIYRYVQWPRPASAADPAAAPVEEIFAQASGFDPPNYAHDFPNHWTNRNYDTGIPTVWLEDAAQGEATHNRTSRLRSGKVNSAYRPKNLDYIGLVEQYRRCYCECIIEKHDKQPDRNPQVLGAVEYKAALDACKKAAIDSKRVAKKVDWDVLLLACPSPYLFTMRDMYFYNSIIDGTTVPAGGAAYVQRGNLGATRYAVTAGDVLAVDDIDPIRRAVGGAGAKGFLCHIAGKGVLPGLTIVQTLDGATWDKIHPPTGNNESSICTSGLGTALRSCLLHYSTATYKGDAFCYSVTANAAHELGHVLDRTHQPPNPNNGDLNFHEKQTPNGAKPDKTFTCVMGYMGCYGEYCGRCGLALRGWRTKSMHNDQGA